MHAVTRRDAGRGLRDRVLCVSAHRSAAVRLRVPSVRPAVAASGCTRRRPYRRSSRAPLTAEGVEVGA
jgi:hypothetical protein